MSEKIRLVQGDTRPSLVTTLTDSTTGAAINITGATVRLKFRAAGSPTVRSTLIGTVTDGAAGTVVFDWSDDPTSLDGDPGDYEGEIEITFADTTIQTVYDLLKFKLRQDF
jgi:hypothetical protein